MLNPKFGYSWLVVLVAYLSNSGAMAESAQITKVYRNPFQGASKSMKKSLSNANASALSSCFITLNYAKAEDLVRLFKDKNNPMLTDAAKILADQRTNSLWIQEYPEQLKKIKALLAELDIPVKQVLIEAKIVDLSRDCAEDLGVKFALAGTAEAGAKAIQLQKLNFDLGALPYYSEPAVLGLALAKLAKGVLLDLELSAMQNEGRAEIIASPRILTTNQQTALIESGEDIPYQETTASGATSVAFKKAVLSLRVTPQISQEGNLLMDLKINQDSDSGSRVQGVPVIMTKAIETSVLVRQGETIVLGGIYKQDQKRALQRVPFLAALPLLGPLFKREQRQNRKEELLIFITPRIIDSDLNTKNPFS